MKHLLRVLCPILVLLIAATVFVVCDVMSARDQVTVECETLYGDRSQAHGITLDMEATYEGHMFWNTSFTEAAVPTIQTEYTFYGIERRYDLRLNRDPLVMSLDIPRGDEAVKMWNLENLYSEDIAQLEPGEKLEKTLAIWKHCEYYPISVSVNLPHNYQRWTGNVLKQEEQSLIDGHVDVAAAFNEFFRIPVWVTEFYTVSLSRSSNGAANISAHRAAGGDSFDIETRSVQSDDAFFFVFDVHTFRGSVTDTRDIKGGFGIYRLPYGFDDKHGDLELYADKLETVFALDPRNYILDLELSEDGKLLYLTTVEYDILCITVIETGAFAQVQKVAVSQVKNRGSQVSCYMSNGHIAAMTDDKWLHVLSYDEQGRLKIDFSAELDADSREIIRMYDKFVMGYDGERLVLCMQGFNETPCIYMNVYTEQGVVFKGKYTTGLNKMRVGDTSIYGKDFMTISFE